jgi:DNA polymerase-3 subunit gamma/tau
VTYLVLARKYRPERFSEMIGQEHVTRTLANAIANGRVHHAYLFCGVRGLGKTSAARILARGLVCELGPSPDPCNVCEQCRAVIEGRSVDVREIDGASNNSVDDIRQLREQVHYLPQSARRKIYIIDEVHMLSAAAFNALLKTLEEPPPHVTFIFATTDPHKVLGTILSRVSRLDFRRVAPQTLVEHLQKILEKEGYFVEPQGLHTIAVCGDGSVRDSLTLLDKVISFAQDPAHIYAREVQDILGQSDKNAIFDLVDAILAHDAGQALSTLDAILASTSDLAQFSMALLQHFRDLNVAKVGGQACALIDAGPSRLERLLAQAERVEGASLGQLFDRFTRALERIDRSRAPRLTLEMAIVDLAQAESLMPLGAVIEQLREISQGGRSGPLGGSPGPGARSSSSASTSPAPRGGGSQFASTMGASAPVSRPSAAASEAVATNRTQREPAASYSPSMPASEMPAHADPALVDDLWKMIQGVKKEVAPASAASRPGASFDSSPSTAAAQKKTSVNELAARPSPTMAPSRAVEVDVATPSLSGRETRAEPQPREVAPVENKVNPATTRAVSPSTSPASSAANGSQRAGVTSFTPFQPSPQVEPWEASPTYERWETFLRSGAIAGNELLFATLAEFGVARFDEGGLKWVIPKESFAHDQINKRAELKLAFETALVAYFGREVEITREVGVPSLSAAPSLSLVERHRAAEHRATIEKMALDDPRIGALVSTFDAKVRTVEVLAQLARGDRAARAPQPRRAQTAPGDAIEAAARPDAGRETLPQVARGEETVATSAGPNLGL